MPPRVRVIGIVLLGLMLWAWNRDPPSPPTPPASSRISTATPLRIRTRVYRPGIGSEGDGSASSGTGLGDHSSGAKGVGSIDAISGDPLVSSIKNDSTAFGAKRQGGIATISGDPIILGQITYLEREHGRVGVDHTLIPEVALQRPPFPGVHPALPGAPSTRSSVLLDDHQIQQNGGLHTNLDPSKFVSVSSPPGADIWRALQTDHGDTGEPLHPFLVALEEVPDSSVLYDDWAYFLLLEVEHLMLGRPPGALGWDDLALLDDAWDILDADNRDHLARFLVNQHFIRGDIEEAEVWAARLEDEILSQNAGRPVLPGALREIDQAWDRIGAR